MSTVLLVEDNVDNQLVIEDIFDLEDIGAELVIAESAEEALAQLPDVRPILVLMDVGLPGMSGLEAARIIKGNPETKGIAVWAITAHAMKSAGQDALAAGCDHYVSKPIKVAELAERLRAFARAWASRRAA